MLQALRSVELRSFLPLLSTPLDSAIRHEQIHRTTGEGSDFDKLLLARHGASRKPQDARFFGLPAPFRTDQSSREAVHLG